MRRINIVIDPALDDRLEDEASARGMSKSALVRDCVERGLAAEPFDNGVMRLVGELSPLFAEIEPEDIDTVLYGPLEADR